MSDKDCNNICRMLNNMCVKVNKSNADTNSTAYALQRSFVQDSDIDCLNYTEWEDMARNWIGIDDDMDIINKEVDEAMEYM